MLKTRIALAALAAGTTSGAAHADVIYNFEGAVTSTNGSFFGTFGSVDIGEQVAFSVTIDSDPVSTSSTAFGYNVNASSLSIGGDRLDFVVGGTATVFNNDAFVGDRFEGEVQDVEQFFEFRSLAAGNSLLTGTSLPTQTELDGLLNFRGRYDFVDLFGGGQDSFFRVEFTNATVVPAPGSFATLTACGLLARRRRR